jgi:hypothetical protein
MSLIALAALHAAPRGAYAQQDCTDIPVTSVRLARVDVYSLRAVFQETVTRESLGRITVAKDCGVPSFLMIETPNGPRLVRPVALELPPTIALPDCAEGQFESQATRNASSSGLGGPVCRRTK